MMIVIMAGLVMVALGVFGIIEVQRPFIFIVTADAITFLVIMIFMLKYAAEINQSFKTQMNIISQIKYLFQQLLRGAEIYFDEDFHSKKYLLRQALKNMKS